MASVAERKRNRKANARASASARPASDLEPRRLIKTGSYVRRQTGLQSLGSKGKINRRQAARGEAYGRLYRVSTISNGVAIPSALGDLDRVRGTGGALMLNDYSAIIVEARELLAAARGALGFHTGLILACDLVCGRGLTPQEITEVRREAEEIETSLRIALDLLDDHFGDVASWWT